MKRVKNNLFGNFAIQIYLLQLLQSNLHGRFVTIASRSFEILMKNNDVTLFSTSYIDLVLVCHNVDVMIDKVRGLFAGISSSGAQAVSPSEAVRQFEAMDWYT